MKYSHKTKGICAPQIDFEVDGGRVHDVKFHGGCTGNTGAITALIEGQKTEDVIKKLEGIQCRNGTSCPDQLAKALKKTLANE